MWLMFSFIFLSPEILLQHLSQMASSETSLRRYIFEATKTTLNMLPQTYDCLTTSNSNMEWFQVETAQASREKTQLNSWFFTIPLTF